MKLYVVPCAFLPPHTVVSVPCESTKCSLRLCLDLTMKRLELITACQFLFYYFKGVFYCHLRGGEGERQIETEREKYRHKRETSIGCLSHVPPREMEQAHRACPDPTESSRQPFCAPGTGPRSSPLSAPAMAFLPTFRQIFLPASHQRVS